MIQEECVGFMEACAEVVEATRRREGAARDVEAASRRALKLAREITRDWSLNDVESVQAAWTASLKSVEE